MEGIWRSAVGGQLDFAPLLQAVIAWREPIVFVVLVAESVPFLGLAAPGLLVLVLAGFVGEQFGVIASSRLIAVAFAAIFLSDLALFTLGRVSGDRATWIKRRIGANSSIGDALARQGDGVLSLYQFPPYSRMLAPLLLGCAGFRFHRWLRVSIAGTALFVAIFFGAGFAAGALSGEAATVAAGAAVASTVFAFALAGWVAALAVRVWRKNGVQV